MSYLYHWVPSDMKGSILYPLNTLKIEHPDLYDLKSSKYIGREKVMELVVPILNCLWNDVLHFTAIHPSVVKEALIQAGRKGYFNMECYEIDPNLLDPRETIVYLYTHDSIIDNMGTENFKAYNPLDIDAYSTLPQETKEYYKEMFAKNKNLLYSTECRIFYTKEQLILGIYVKLKCNSTY